MSLNIPYFYLEGFPKRDALRKKEKNSDNCQKMGGGKVTLKLKIKLEINF